MRIGVPKEIHPDERRVAATPETVKKIVALGHTVLVQAGAGEGARILDDDYRAAGASLTADAAALYGQAELFLKVRGPEAEELAMIRSGSLLIGLLAPHRRSGIESYCRHGLTCFSLEFLPRVSRAQSMDVLSSQANIAGYKAVMLAAHHYPRLFPLLMTAAGTIRPARVLVLGVGVAGLMAIATAKRLGAVIEAFDVRPAAKEQVESLGAKFVEVPLAPGETAETAGGYAREMTEDYKKRQAELVHKHAAASDIVITTALIPGRPAPVLLPEATVRAMKPGSVIVDLAAEAGGNCPLTEAGKISLRDGITLIGLTNLPSLVSADSSALYSRNVFNFLELLLKGGDGGSPINLEDEIITGTLVCMAGELKNQKS